MSLASRHRFAFVWELLSGVDLLCLVASFFLPSPASYSLLSVLIFSASAVTETSRLLTLSMYEFRVVHGNVPTFRIACMQAPGDDD